MASIISAPQFLNGHNLQLLVRSFSSFIIYFADSISLDSTFLNANLLLGNIDNILNIASTNSTQGSLNLSDVDIALKTIISFAQIESEPGDPPFIYEGINFAFSAMKIAAPLERSSVSITDKFDNSATLFFPDGFDSSFNETATSVYDLRLILKNYDPFNASMDQTSLSIEASLILIDQENTQLNLPQDQDLKIPFIINISSNINESEISRFNNSQASPCKHFVKSRGEWSTEGCSKLSIQQSSISCSCQQTGNIALDFESSAEDKKPVLDSITESQRDMNVFNLLSLLLSKHDTDYFLRSLRLA